MIKKPSIIEGFFYSIKLDSYIFNEINIAAQQKTIDDHLLSNYTSFKSSCCTAALDKTK